MKSISKKTAVVICLLLTTGSSFLAWAKYHRPYTAKVMLPKLNKDTLVQTVIDTAKLKLLQKVYENFNMNRDEFLIEGNITAVNGADTTDHLDKADYIFSKKGTSFYFKIGQTETINAKGKYIFIDHGIKKIMLSKQKNVIPEASMPDLNQLIAQIKEEGFNLLDTKNGDTEKITLSNPYHLSCKEYTVIFNTLTLQPEKLYIRLTDFSAPENAKMDNVISFKIRKSVPLSGIEKYTAGLIVKKEKNTWHLEPDYKDYELINTLN